MKRVLLAFVLAFLSKSVFAQLDSVRWKTIKTDLYSISFFKKDWTQFTDSIMGATFIVATNQTIKKPYDRDIVQLRIMDNEDEIYGDLETYAAQAKAALVKGGTLISAELVKKGNQEYHEKVVKNYEGKIKRKIRERRYFINNKVYELTFDAAESVFDKKMVQVDTIFNSLVITDLEASTVAKWETFDTPQYALTYPNNWKKEKNLPQNTEFIFKKPKKSSDKGYWDNVYLMVNTFKETTPELTSFSKKATEQLKTTLKNAKIIQSTKKKLGKLNYQEVISEGTLGQNPIKMRQWHFVKGKKAYTLTYSARVNGYNDMLPIVDQIFNSFILK